MATKLYSLNGNNVKGISLTDAQSWIDAGFSDWGLDKHTLTPSSAYSMSGWVFRCVNIRANAVAALPWALYRGETEIADSTGDNHSAGAGLDWIDDLPTMLYLAEGAMSILGVAYWYKVRTRGKQINEMKWLAPDTMTPKWSREGLQYFERKIGSDTLRLPVDDVVYFRYPNPLHETEPGVSPVAAALADVGVIVNLTEFASQFFKRGAIRSTLLTVDGMPPEGEKQRLKSWWQRVIGGIGNAFAAEVVSAAVTPVVIGDGVESLNNESLTAEKRESISTALGVPHSLVMSNAANFATAEADRLNFYDTTVIPVARIVERVMNRQLFDGMGYRFEFRPEALSIYQENEEQRADAVLKYTSAGLPLSLTFEMLGIQLPAGWEYTDLDQEPETITVVPEQQQAPEPQPADVADAPQDAPMPDDRKAAEIDTFKRWLKRNPNRLDRVSDFKSDVLTDEEKAGIAAEVKAAEDGDAEDTPFPVTLPTDGSITPEWWRATKATLQLNADDPEAEQAARMAIERRATREMSRSLEEWLNEALDGLTEAEVQELAYRLRNGQATFRDVLQRALVQSSDLGVSVAFDQFESVGFGFDYTLVNTGAREWARQHTDNVLAQLNTTNDRVVGEAVARWMDNGEPLSALEIDLRQHFGKRRAELISSTEVTRAYAEANRIAYEQSGVVETIEWRTANDEKVCPICGPLGGIAMANVGSQQPKLGEGGNVRTSVRNPQFQHPNGMTYGVPPAHPRCRCWIVPVVAEVETAAVEPQVSASPQVQTLTRVESEIYTQQYETAIVVNENGDVIIRKDGNSNEVSFTRAEADRMKGLILTHNHPSVTSGSSFSNFDMLILQQAELKSIRAITVVEGRRVLYEMEVLGSDYYSKKLGQLKASYTRAFNKSQKNVAPLVRSKEISNSEGHRRVVDGAVRGFVDSINGKSDAPLLKYTITELD